MITFYTREEKNSLQKKLFNRLALVGVISLATIALYIASFWLGIFWLSFVAGCVAVIISFTLYLIFVTPVFNQYKLINEILRGKDEEESLTFEEVKEETLRHGVEFTKVNFKGMDFKGNFFVRTVYLQKNKELPFMVPGEDVLVTTYENIITSIKRI